MLSEIMRAHSDSTAPQMKRTIGGDICLASGSNGCRVSRNPERGDPAELPKSGQSSCPNEPGGSSPIPLKNAKAAAFYPSAKFDGELVLPACRSASSAARGRDHAVAPWGGGKRSFAIFRRF